MKAREIELDTQTRNGTGRGARVEFKGVPIVYAPWLTFPIGSQRKSGFLFPNIGASSRNGGELELPYYWNIRPNLDLTARPVYCTKVASRLARTFTDRHSLKDLCKELLGIELSKQQQSSDWGAAELSPEQLNYAASDVLHLHALREKLDAMLRREGREQLAKACFEFLPTRAELDLQGWGELDPFAH